MANSTQGIPSQCFSKDFWKFWSGQTISTLGSSFSGFALPLLVFNLTGSSLNLALTVVAQVLPYLLFGLFIGAWIDRLDRKRWMIITDLLRALVIASIPLLALLSLLSVWWIYLVAFINAALSIGFDAANFAAIPSLVNKDDLVRANGRIQASYSLARVVGPLLAGLLLAIVSIPMLLFVDAFSYLVSAASLALVKASFNADRDTEKVRTSVYQDIGEGLRYVLGHPVLFWLTLLLLLINFITPTASAQLVLFARQWLGASDTQIGLLFSGASVGVVVCSLLAGRLRRRWSFSQVALGALMLEGLMTMVPALTHWYWVAFLAWALRSGASILFNISTYSLAQSIVPNHLLGRVITFIRVLTWSTASLGALLGGFAIERSGSVALVYAGVGVLVFIIAFAFSFTPLGHNMGVVDRVL